MIRVALTFVSVYVFAALPVSASDTWHTWEQVRITDNPVHDITPDTDGVHVSWTGYRYAGGYDIGLYDISSGAAQYISTTPFAYPITKVRGNYVAWGSDRGLELYRINTGTTSLLSSRPAFGGLVDIIGNDVYYTAKVGTGYELFRYSELGSTTTQLTTAHMPSYNICFRGTDLAHQSIYQTVQGKMYYYNMLNNQEALLNNDDTNGYPAFAGNYLFWEHIDPRFGGTEIYYANLSTFATAKLADGSHPHVLNDVVYWSGSDGSGKEVFKYDPVTATLTQLTNSNFAGLSLTAGGGTVTWFDGVTSGGNDGTKYFYDGSTIESLPHTFSGNTYGYYTVSDIGVVGETDIEVFLWRPTVVPEPATLALLAVGGLVALRRRR